MKIGEKIGKELGKRGEDMKIGEKIGKEQKNEENMKIDQKNIGNVAKMKERKSGMWWRLLFHGVASLITYRRLQERDELGQDTKKVQHTSPHFTSLQIKCHRNAGNER